MSIPQYAHGRSQLPSPVVSQSTGGGFSAAVAGTYYFALQGRNRIGLNLLSAIVGPFTVAAGGQITIEIPATARADCEDWLYFIVSASNSNDPTSFQQIAWYQGYGGIDNSVPTPLPAVITLYRDAHLAFMGIVANPLVLPTGEDLLPGMVRGVAATTYFYSYDPNSTAEPNDSTVLASALGRWVRSGPPGVNVSDTTQPGGCAQDIREINDGMVLAPDYGVDSTPGRPIKLWRYNNTGGPIQQGTRLGLTLQIGEAESTKALNGLLRIKFLGFANPVTGELDKTGEDGVGEMQGVDEETLFQARKSGIILQKDLLDGYAYALEVYPEFDDEDLDGEAPIGARLKAYPFFFSQAGEYSEAGVALGEDWIYPTADRRRAVPDIGLGVILLSGGYMVDSLSIRSAGKRYVSGLLPDTENQKIVVNGLGASFVENGTVQSTEAIRAIVGTKDGGGVVGAWSNYVITPENAAISINCKYPCDDDGFGIIDPDYPDRIAGNSKGIFNPSSVTIYLQNLEGEIRAFSGYGIAAGAEEDFTIFDWDDGQVISELPVAELGFGLFKPGATVATTVPGGGSLPAGSLRACFRFDYYNRVTRISHDEVFGCMFEPSSTLLSVFARIKYYGEGLADLSALRALSKADVNDLESRRIRALRQAYVYDSTSYAVDDGSNTSKVVRLFDTLESEPGRFISDDSTRWYATDSNPDDALGYIGDFHLHLQTGNISSKQSSSWELLGNFRGSRWYTGADDPDPADGAVGDFYVKATGPFYEKTAVDLWTQRGTFKGATGAAGTVSAASSLILNPTAEPTTGPNDYALYIDQADLRFKLKPSGNGNEEGIPLLNHYNVYGAAQIVAPSSVTSTNSTPVVDLSLSNEFDFLLTQDISLNEIYNLTSGGRFLFFFLQDNVGGRTVTFNSSIFKFTGNITPTIDLSPNNATIMDAYCRNGLLFCSMRQPYIL